MYNDIKPLIRHIEDFPKKGVTFRDLAPVYANKESLKNTVNALAQEFLKWNTPIDYVASLESQGFVVGGALAHTLGAGFIQIRKKDELPGNVEQVSFEMQYATSTLEIQTGIFPEGKNVLLYDDTLVTGNTATHAAYLIEKIGLHVIGFSFIMHLTGMCNPEKMLKKPCTILYAEPV